MQKVETLASWFSNYWSLYAVVSLGNLLDMNILEPIPDLLNEKLGGSAWQCVVSAALRGMCAHI